MQRLNPFVGNIHFDANIADHIKALDRSAVVRILQLNEEGDINLIVPQSVRQELLRSATPSVVRSVAFEHIFTMSPLTSEEQAEQRTFIEALRGDAKPENIDCDLKHVWDAAKHGGRFFLTVDRRLLKRADKIFEHKLICVLTPEDFVTQIDAALARGDPRPRRNVLR